MNVRGINDEDRLRAANLTFIPFCEKQFPAGSMAEDPSGATPSLYLQLAV
jgi:hypothetical protein